MSYNRNSLLVKLGRLFQDGYKYLSFLDYFVKMPLSLRRKRVIPVVCIVSPPRSGSTLTYQILTNRINNFHLTNIWNLLYSTPAIGAQISKLICRNYKTPFRSNNGFVPGVCGESEGLKFWTYWSGQALTENEDKLDAGSLSKLYGTLQEVGGPGVFITGYLGHVFCMECLRRAFPKIIFVHVTRDLLSNTYSMYQRSCGGWFSIKPKELQDRDFNSVHEQVVEQVFSIHKSILHASKPSDTIQICYEEMCEDPEKVINKVVCFSKQQDIGMEVIAHNLGPFRANKITSTDDADAVLLYDLINKKILQETRDQAFFQSLQ